MRFKSRIGDEVPESIFGHLFLPARHMIRTTKRNIPAPARHLRGHMASTRGRMPKPRIDPRLCKDALRSPKKHAQPAASRVKQVVPLSDPAPTVKIEAVENQFGFSFLRRMPNTEALSTLRSQLAVALPELDRVGSAYNAAIDARAPERFQLLRETYQRLHSVHTMTAEYATFAEDALGTPGHRVTAAQLTALSNILDEMGTELDRLWTAVQATHHVAQARNSSLSNDSETSESLVN